MILQHAKKKIHDATNHDTVLTGDHDTIATTTGIYPHVENSNSNSNSNNNTIGGEKQQHITGLLLNRRGDGETSFLKFCCDAGKAVLSEKETIVDDLVRVATVLANLGKAGESTSTTTTTTAAGVVLELLAMTLISTRQATTSTDGNILVLCPNDNIAPLTIVNGRIPTLPLSIDEADLAIFKLTGAIRSLERRIESLSTQMETSKRQAVQAKRAGNERKALQYLKRRQIVSNELDNCSGSLYNLETTLHSLDRARNNAQVMNAYRMMNA